MNQYLGDIRPGSFCLSLCPAASLNALDGDKAAAVGAYQSLVVFAAQGSTSVLSPHKSFSSPGETFRKHLAQQVSFKSVLQRLVGIQYLGIKSLMIEYLSLGKLSLARAVWNQFTVPRGKHLKKSSIHVTTKNHELCGSSTQETPRPRFILQLPVASVGTRLFPYLIFPQYLKFSRQLLPMLRCSVVSDFFNPMDDRLPGSSVHGTFPARIPEWTAISFSRGVLPT